VRMPVCDFPRSVHTLFVFSYALGWQNIPSTMAIALIPYSHLAVSPAPHSSNLVRGLANLSCIFISVFKKEFKDEL
jgi:hypothetical protein